VASAVQTPGAATGLFNSTLGGHRGSVEQSKGSVGTADRTESTSRINTTTVPASYNNIAATSTSNAEDATNHRPISDKALLDEMKKRTNRTIL